MKDKRTLGIAAASLIGMGLLMALQFVLGRAAATTIQRITPTLTPAQALIFAAVIRVQDLPPGWRATVPGMEEQPGAEEGRAYYFYGTNDPDLTWVNVSERLFVFKDGKAAQENYEKQMTERFPPKAADAWKHIPELEFSHRADEIKVACLPGRIDGDLQYSCKTMARYSNVVIVMMGNVYRDKWLTMADFRAVLEAMDRRIVAALSQ